MAFCKYCGQLLPDDSIFCPSCGKKVMLKKSKSEKQEPLKKTEICTLIVNLKNAGLGERPKILLDNKEVGKASIYNEVSLSVPTGQHTLLLKGTAGGGRIANINIKESDIVKKCIFNVNIMSLKERYYLDNVYTEGENPISEDMLPAKSEELQTENTLSTVTYQRKNKSGTMSKIAIGVVIGLIVFFVINNPIDLSNNKQWAEKVPYSLVGGSQISSSTWVDRENGYEIVCIKTYTENGLGMKKEGTTYYAGFKKGTDGKVLMSPYYTTIKQTKEWCQKN